MLTDHYQFSASLECVPGLIGPLMLEENIHHHSLRFPRLSHVSLPANRTTWDANFGKAHIFMHGNVNWSRPLLQISVRSTYPVIQRGVQESDALPHAKKQDEDVSTLGGDFLTGFPA